MTPLARTFYRGRGNGGVVLVAHVENFVTRASLKVWATVLLLLLLLLYNLMVPHNSVSI